MLFNNNSNNNCSIIIEYICKKLSQSSTIRDSINENDWTITQIGSSSFEFYNRVLEVEFYFHFEYDNEELIILNDHRYSRYQEKGNGYSCMSIIETIFIEISKKLRIKKLVIIFEIKNITNSSSNLVRKLLTKLNYKQTQDKNPEKWVKICPN